MIRIAAVAPLTTDAFPGRMAAVLFLQGCPWRCSYCRDPDLLPARGSHPVLWEQAVALLEDRRDLLDGVVFSGGEPTAQPNLHDAIHAVRDMGFATAIHTAGTHPMRLIRLLSSLDWVGLDIKAPRSRYAQVTRRGTGTDTVWDALAWILDTGVEYECRTTWHPDLYPEHELRSLGRDLARRGVRHWVVQECKLAGHARWQPPDMTALNEALPGVRLHRA